MLPAKSQLSIKGFWFVLNKGHNTIHYHISGLGKETVYYNEDVVSQKKSNIRLKSDHFFDTSTGASYFVSFEMKMRSKLHIECLFFENNQLVKKVTANRVGNSKLNKLWRFASIIFGVFMGVTIAITGFSGLFFIIMGFYLCLYIFVQRLSAKTNALEIQEEIYTEY